MSGIDPNGSPQSHEGDPSKPGPESSWAITPPPADENPEASVKNPDTTGADASPEAGVNPDELAEDEKDREIRYS